MALLNMRLHYHEDFVLPHYHGVPMEFGGFCLYDVIFHAMIVLLLYMCGVFLITLHFLGYVFNLGDMLVVL